MTATTLTDRYIDAATRSVPEKQRAELSAELRERIADEIDARRDTGETGDAAEVAVLTELGDPAKLAAAYLDRPLQLIGPRYYLAWRRLLKLLWAIVPACAAFGVALGQTLAGAGIGEIIAATISVVIGVVVHVAFWVTVVFVVVERSTGGADVGFVGGWSVDQLPEPKEKGAGLGDLVASLVLLALAAGAVLWDRFVGTVYTADGGEWMPFLAPDLWPWWITGLLVLLVLEALLAIAVYARGRWDAATATINAILNLVIVVPAVWLLLNRQLLNPSSFAMLLPEDGETVATIVATALGFGIVGVAAWDSIDAFLKARRAA